ncbi:UNVERIFIED_CONTAM: hypothetical protein Slati_1472500 [Sesamum latifolium]|uniref:Uncharacterized protein n=1 Tax=Sesamum latifolium TaxID=2727402 RepID=A0AAW2X8A9_9LAMI
MDSPSSEALNRGTEALSAKVDEEMSRELFRSFTMEEVTKALFQMALYKSSGPDCRPPAFFQHFWPLLQSDICASVLHFLNNHILVNLTASH